MSFPTPARALTLDHVTLDVQRRCVEGRRLGMLRVLTDCSLHVGVGEILAVVGPAGSGKSAVLDLLAGFAHASSGQVLVDGHVVAGPSPDRGFVQPSYGLFPWRTVRQNVTFAAGAAGVRRADAALALVGLAAVADRPVGDLTATQKRRVSLAKALVHDPGVLLLDDPFAGLADADRADLQDALLGIQAETGVTVVIATRNVDEAVRLADRVAVLSPLPGRVVTQVPVNSGRPHAARHAVWAALAGVEGYAAAA